MRSRLLVPLILALYCAASTAQLYSWKDASGKVHYSDEPPSDKATTRKVAPPATGAGDPNAKQVRAEQEMAARKKQKEADEAATKAAKDKADAEQRRVECERAKGNVQALESGQVRFTTNANGEKVSLDGAVRDAEIANARRVADSWCK